MPPYAYSTSNGVLKEQFKLQGESRSRLISFYQNLELITTFRLAAHPEGGYYAETDRRKEEIPSPYAGASLLDLIFLIKI